MHWRDWNLKLIHLEKEFWMGEFLINIIILLLINILSVKYV